MKTFSATAPCPDCGRCSGHRHSRYVRTLADPPGQGVAVRLEIEVRKFFCDQPDCARKIFTERLREVAVPYGRRTLRLTEVFELVELLMGGEAGARTVGNLRMATSPDTLLRAVRRLKRPPAPTPRVLGVDDFAFRRGHHYGTILVDLERRQVVDLLPDRTADTLKAWLAAHPGVEIITRDRAGAYAKGARAGASKAIQIADQWHIFKNLRDTLERFLSRYQQLLREVAKPEPRPQKPASASPPAVDPVGPVTPTRPQEIRARQREFRLGRFQDVTGLAGQGFSHREIARRTGLSRQTVRKFARADQFPKINRRKTRPGILRPFIAYLETRLKAGCRNGTQLWREIVGQGFRGCAVLVRHWCAAACRQQGLHRRTPDGSQPVAQPAEKLSPHRARWLLTLRVEQLEP